MRLSLVAQHDDVGVEFVRPLDDGGVWDAVADDVLERHGPGVGAVGDAFEEAVSLVLDLVDDEFDARARGFAVTARVDDEQPVDGCVVLLCQVEGVFDRPVGAVAPVVGNEDGVVEHAELVRRDGARCG